MARAEAARLRKELARAKARAAAKRIRRPLSDRIANFLSALFTPVSSGLGGSVYSLGSSGSLWVPPGSFGSGSAPFMMNGGVALPIMTFHGQPALATAQLQPAGVIFSPKVRVFFDLLQPAYAPVEVKDFKTGRYQSFIPAVWAFPTSNPLVAYADMAHFCSVGLFAPKPGEPTVPKPTEVVTAPPTQEEVIAKEKKEEAASSALNKQYADSYKLIAKTAKLNYATRAQKEDTQTAKAETAQRAKDKADRRAQALADRRARDNERAQEAQAEERSRRLEEVDRQAREEQQEQAQEQRAQQRAQGHEQRRAQQQEQAQQQRRAQQQEEAQPQRRGQQQRQQQQEQQSPEQRQLQRQQRHQQQLQQQLQQQRQLQQQQQPNQGDDSPGEG